MPDGVLALVPARGGSKGVQRKNVRPLLGKPLIAWTIECAFACATVNRVVVSTDDEEIASAARAYGAETPFLRPAELAADSTPDLPVYMHALEMLAAHGFHPAATVWLRPTAPLRTVADMDGALDLLHASGADCVRSVCAVEHHPYWMRRLDGDRLEPFLEGLREENYPRRQLLPPAYRLNGAVDVVRASSIKPGASALFGGDVRGFVMPQRRSIDLDSELDFVVAEALLGMREQP